MILVSVDERIIESPTVFANTLPAKWAGRANVDRYQCRLTTSWP